MKSSPSSFIPIEYRPMKASDIDAARRLWDSCEGVEVSEGDSEPELTRYLERNPRMSQVAVSGGRLVGAVLAGHDGRRGYLYHLAVESELRGRGVGHELVKRSMASLREAGVPRVLILVVAHNEVGKDFWLRQEWERLEDVEAMGLTFS